ncbi:hypothetical protein ANTPLA_LOCUS1567 [Anthophora plagiata]
MLSLGAKITRTPGTSNKSEILHLNLEHEETKQKKKKKKRSNKEKTDSPVARLLCTYRYGSSSCALKASRLNLAK